MPSTSRPPSGSDVRGARLSVISCQGFNGHGDDLFRQVPDSASSPEISRCENGARCTMNYWPTLPRCSADMHSAKCCDAIRPRKLCRAGLGGRTPPSGDDRVYRWSVAVSSETQQVPERSRVPQQREDGHDPSYASPPPQYVPDLPLPPIRWVFTPRRSFCGTSAGSHVFRSVTATEARSP